MKPPCGRHFVLWNQKRTDTGSLLFAGMARSHRRFYALGCSYSIKARSVGHKRALKAALVGVLQSRYPLKLSSLRSAT